MIFRVVHGRFKECLAITPAIREWKIRNPNDKLFVETSFPELFVHNPNVDSVGMWFDDGPVIDFDIVDTINSDIHPVDLYSLVALGDLYLHSRQMQTFISPVETEIHAVLVGTEFAKTHESAVETLRLHFGDVAEIDIKDIGKSLMALSRAEVYIGIDEDVSWLAMTTDVPIVMCCGPRQEKSCRPFRWLIPFESVTCECEWANVCLRRFASTGFGKLFHINCQKEIYMACEKLIPEQVIVEMAKKMVKYRQGLCIP